MVKAGWAGAILLLLAGVAVFVLADRHSPTQMNTAVSPAATATPSPAASPFPATATAVPSAVPVPLATSTPAMPNQFEIKPVSPAAGQTVAFTGLRLAWASVSYLGDIASRWRHAHVEITPHSASLPPVDILLHRDDAPDRSLTAVRLADPTAGYRVIPSITYTWRVRVSGESRRIGIDEPLWGPWSDSSTFHVAPLPLDQLRPVFPVSDMTVLAGKPAAITWDYDRRWLWWFEIQMSEDEQFETSAATATKAVWWNYVQAQAWQWHVTWRTPALEPYRTYYWRVRPLVERGDPPGAWSPTFQFRTEEAGGTPPVWWPGTLPPKGPSAFLPEEMEARQVSARSARHPHWLGNDAIAVAVSRDDTTLDAVRFGPDGTEQAIASLRGDLRNTAWSSNHQFISIEYVGNGTEIAHLSLLDAPTGTVRQIGLPNGTAVDLAADGGRLFYFEYRRGNSDWLHYDIDAAKILDLDTGETQSVRLQTPLGVGKGAMRARWSSRQDTVVYFSCYEGCGGPFLLNLADGSARKLGVHRSDVQGSPNPFAYTTVAAEQWSPDGSLLAIVSTDGLHVFDLAGNDRLIYPAARRDDWSSPVVYTWLDDQRILLSDIRVQPPVLMVASVRDRSLMEIPMPLPLQEHTPNGLAVSPARDLLAVTTSGHGLWVVRLPEWIGSLP